MFCVPGSFVGNPGNQLTSFVTVLLLLSQTSISISMMMNETVDFVNRWSASMAATPPKGGGRGTRRRDVKGGSWSRGRRRFVKCDA